MKDGLVNFTWSFYMKKGCLFIILSIILFTTPIIAFGSDQNRIALIIGNSDYRTAPLNNPVNDARDMADALRQLKFKVIEKINADKKDIILSIDEFYNQLRRSDVGIFYYAGHGMQIQGTNYLIPVDAHVTSEADIQFEAIDAGRVLGKMNDAGNKMNIVILDACRDNPFKRSFRTERQGLAQMDAPKGTIIAYATAPGSVAAEGTGRNGIYTKYLLKNMRKPELSVMEVFRETGLGVMQETQDKQIPWVSTTPIQRYYLAGGSAVIQKLSPKSRKSQIEISANVSGARVLVDGRGVGATPTQGVEVSPGSHRIRLEKEGYEAYEKSVLVEAGRTFSIQVYLDKKKPQKGRLYVETDPRDAKVNIPGIIRFYQGIELDPGKYWVEVSADGHETKKVWIQVKPGEDKNLKTSLIHKEQFKRILIQEQEVSRNPENVAAWTQLGNLYFDTNNFKKAIWAYKKSLTLNPNNANAQTDLGVMYRRNGQSTKAIKAFDKAIQIDPAHEIARFNKGIVLLHDLNDKNGAIKTWEELVQINPDALTPGGKSLAELIKLLK